MRYYTHLEQGDDGVTPVSVTVSEEDIREQYYTHWSELMVARFGKEVFERDYTFEHCLDDWAVGNWSIVETR